MMNTRKEQKERPKKSAYSAAVLPPSQEYQKLILKFPLRPIRNEAEHTSATGILVKLIKKSKKKEITPDENAYLKVLSLLINEYENSMFPNQDEVTPQDVVRFLMEQHDLKQVDLIEEFGTQSLVSDFLNKNRELTKSQIKRLCKRFHISPSLLL